MNIKMTGLSLTILLGASLSAAQNPPAPAAAPAEKVEKVVQADYSSVYCAMFFSDEKVPDSKRVVSGEESAERLVYSAGDNVYINQNAAGGLKVGDEFSVVRPTSNPKTGDWFKWQEHLMKVMGQAYTNVGRIKVVDVRPPLAVAQIVMSCEPLQRGDILQPMAEKPFPKIKDPATFDRFSPDDPKLWKDKHAMVVSTDAYMAAAGKNTVIYVNLGKGQGVKFGDYFRIFRYQGSQSETLAKTLPDGYQYKLFGFGTAEKKYDWKDIPRQVVGEGVVLNLSQNSATVLVTYAWTTVYAGDYVELE